MAQPKLMILGFLLFLVGMVSLMLSFIGLNLLFLEWLDYFGEGIGIVLKLSMSVIGIVLIAVSNTDFKKENEEL